VPVSRRAEPVVEAALAEGLGSDYRGAILPEIAEKMAAPDPPGRRLVPFLLFDRDVRVTRDVPYLDDGDPKHRLDIYAPRAGAA